MSYLPWLFWTRRIFHCGLNLTGWDPGIVTKWWAERGQRSRHRKDHTFRFVIVELHFHIRMKFSDEQWSFLCELSTHLSGKYPQWSSTCLSLFITGRTHSSGPKTEKYISAKWELAIKEQQAMCLTTTSEASPSSRLVGIGTTTCELAALSSVTEPCNRKCTAVNPTSSVQRGQHEDFFYSLGEIHCLYKLRLSTEQKTHLMSFDDVFQFPEQFGLNVRAQVDDGSRQAVVLK